MIAVKQDLPYSSTISWIRCLPSFSPLRSAIQCVRGARSSHGRAAKHPVVRPPGFLRGQDPQMSTLYIIIISILFTLLISFYHPYYLLCIIQHCSACIHWFHSTTTTRQQVSRTLRPGLTKRNSCHAKTPGAHFSLGRVGDSIRTPSHRSTSSSLSDRGSVTSQHQMIQRDSISSLATSLNGEK